MMTRTGTLQQIDADKARGNDFISESRVSTLPSAKHKCRAIDVLEILPIGVRVGHQVGKLNLSGSPVAREVRAMNDIFEALDGDVILMFHPYY